jgi:3-isopropylmalate dehydrogenase
MLRYSFELETEAAAVEESIAKVLEQGYRTKDLARDGSEPIGTEEMTNRVIAILTSS